jgi:hypothetical protein
MCDNSTKRQLDQIPTQPNDNSTKYQLDQMTTRPNDNSTKRHLDQNQLCQKLKKNPGGHYIVKRVKPGLADNWPNMAPFFFRIFYYPERDVYAQEWSIFRNAISL